MVGLIDEDRLWFKSITELQTQGGKRWRGGGGRPHARSARGAALLLGFPTCMYVFTIGEVHDQIHS